MDKIKKWNKTPTIEDFKKDFKASEYSHLEHIDKLDFDKRILEDDLYDKRPDDKSVYRSKKFKKISLNIIPKLEQSILSMDRLFQLESINHTSDSDMDMNEDILNHQWRMYENKKFIIGRAAKHFTENGSAILKVGWELKFEIVEKEVIEPLISKDVNEVNSFIQDLFDRGLKDQANQISQQFQQTKEAIIGQRKVKKEFKKVKKNSFTLRNINLQSLRVDPSCDGDFMKANFMIEDVVTSFSELKSSGIKYKNLDLLKGKIKSTSSDTAYGDQYSTTDGDYYRRTNFEFSDFARKKITVHEYWGYWDVHGNGTLTPIVASWYENILIRLEENPFAHKKIPYIIENYFLPDDGGIWGDSHSTIVFQEQRGETNTIRAMQDITNDSTVGQEFVDLSMFENSLQQSRYEKGKRVYVRKGTNPQNSIFRKTTEPVPQVLFDLKGLYSQDVQEFSGFIAQEQPKSGQGVFGSQGQLSDSDREESILGRFSSLFERVASLVLPMNKEYLLNNMPYTDSSGKTKPIRTESLSDQMIPVVDIMTLAKRDMIAKRIMGMMQTNAANMTPEMSALHYIEIADLYGRRKLMQEIQKSIEPKPPTPQEQEMERLQIENMTLVNEKMKADIQKLGSASQELDSKTQERIAKLEQRLAESEKANIDSETQVNVAMADKLSNQSQLFNQEFGLVEDGTKRKYEEMDQEFQHLANLDREEIRTQRELENIDRKKDEKNSDKNIEDPEEQSNNDDLLDYIEKGTVLNDGYDAVDDVYRNILDKNSIDTDEFKEPIAEAKEIKREARSKLENQLFDNDDDFLTEFNEDEKDIKDDAQETNDDDAQL